METLSDKEIQDVLEIFNLYDTKGDKMIYCKHIAQVVRGLGLNPTENDIKKCGYSSEPDQRISFETFLPIYQSLAKSNKFFKEEEFIEAFKVFDKESNGLISAAELRHLLVAMGERLKEEDVDILLNGLENPQGLVPYDSFVKRVMS